MINEIDMFMNYLEYEKGYSEKTFKSYNNDMIQFYRFLMGEFNINDDNYYDIDVEIINDDVAVNSITKDEITGFVEFCYDKGLKKSSISRKIACIKSFFKFLYNNDFISKNPAINIHFPRTAKRVPKFLYYNKIKELLDFELKQFSDFRDRALLELFYSTGARVSEIASANIKDMNLENDTLKVLGKGSVERIVFLTTEASKWMKEYMDRRTIKFGRISEPLIVNNNGQRITERGIFYIVNRRSRMAGIEESVSPHTLRHSFATELMNQGADIRAIQEMLGHKNLTTTQIYTHTTKDRLQRVYNKYHPHSKENHK
ncbi:MAG: site-specific tyrosine recombinase/integron integrase [Spirochaetota bacterium]|nr:site-specific tyrosine recombinase/integron integrase [Spirochaetota bacterium]